jgi:hypothetical protein
MPRVDRRHRFLGMRRIQRGGVVDVAAAAAAPAPAVVVVVVAALELDELELDGTERAERSPGTSCANSLSACA